MKFQESRLLPQFVIVTLLVLFLLIYPVSSLARSGCCSHHGGVCGCGCCDGTSLSSTCAPYYPECSASVTITTISPTPKQTVVKTVVPTVKPTIVPIKSPTQSPSPTPEVMGVSATNNSSPTASPTPNSSGSAFGGLFAFALVFGVPILVIRKIMKKIKDKKNIGNVPPQT